MLVTREKGRNQTVWGPVARPAPPRSGKDWSHLSCFVSAGPPPRKSLTRYLFFRFPCLRNFPWWSDCYKQIQNFLTVTMRDGIDEALFGNTFYSISQSNTNLLFSEAKHKNVDRHIFLACRFSFFSKVLGFFFWKLKRILHKWKSVSSRQVMKVCLLLN